MHHWKHQNPLNINCNERAKEWEKREWKRQKQNSVNLIDKYCDKQQKKESWKFLLSEKFKKIAKIFALQSTPAAMMGASVPWPGTTMMDRVTLDDIPHKGNIFSIPKENNK